MRISDWSSDVCSSDLLDRVRTGLAAGNDRRLGRLDRIDFQIGPMRLERFGHPGDVPAGADAGDDDVDRRVAEILEDLARGGAGVDFRSEEHTSELQSLMRISYAVFCLKK